jgi:hypothetical protein
MTEKSLFADIAGTHEYEEKLRADSMALIRAEAGLSRRLMIIEKAMTVIFNYTVEHMSRNDDEATLQLLGIRMFNAAASGVKLALSGYYQTAFQQARDIMETGFLLDYFRTSQEQIAVWKASDRATRRKLFDPVKVRETLDRRDGDTKMLRAERYRTLSELASHATWRGFAMTTRQGIGELGPFVEPINLKAWLHEMVLRLGPSAVIYANHFPNTAPEFERFFREFGTELVLNFKDPA